MDSLICLPCPWLFPLLHPLAACQSHNPKCLWTCMLLFIHLPLPSSGCCLLISSIWWSLCCYNLAPSTLLYPGVRVTFLNWIYISLLFKPFQWFSVALRKGSNYVKWFMSPFIIWLWTLFKFPTYFSSPTIYTHMLALLDLRKFLVWSEHTKAIQYVFYLAWNTSHLFFI